MTTEYVPRITREGEFSSLVRGKLAEEFVPRSELPAPSTNPNALPAYAGARTHTWKSPDYYPESLSLTALREIVARGLRGTADAELVFVGDSKTEGAGLTGAQAANAGQWSYPAQLRRSLGASEGFIVANVTAGDNRWTLGNMTRSASDRCCVVPAVPGQATVKSAQITTTEAHTGLRIYAQSADGATVTVTIDGAATSWVIPAATGWSERAVSGLADTVHTIKVESTSDFDVSGITPEYPSPRLRITRAGRSSSTAAQWNATTADGLWASTVGSAATTPAALVVGIGTNDPANVAAITAVYARAAALGIPVLCVSPGGLGGLAPYATYAAARDAIYDAADTHGLPLIDFEQVIGEYSTANASGLMGDTVHENAHGYALEAEAVARLVNLS